MNEPIFKPLVLSARKITMNVPWPHEAERIAAQLYEEFGGLSDPGDGSDDDPDPAFVARAEQLINEATATPTREDS